jgi:hypothetical protein
MFFKPMLLPLLAQVLLTFAVWFFLFARRIPEIMRKNIDPQDLRDRAQSHELLVESAAASNNLKNLFEMPVLFYAAILLSLVLLIQDMMLVTLAWGFVILRVAHSVIQCSYNNVNHRFAVYFISCLLLLFMWIRLASFILIH